MKKNKTLSIKDIASLSGVSIATVSRVLNNKGGGYSKQTEEKIKAIAKSYGYISNMAAKTLRESKSHSVGLIVPNISNDFFSTLALHIENIMSEHSYSVFICNSANDIEKEKEYFKSLASKGVDGIICLSGLNILTNEIAFHNIPIVCIDRYSENNKQIPRIASDEFYGSFLATNHLIEKGCKKIVFLGFHSENTIREQGYQQALTDHNILVDKNYIIYTNGKQSSSIEAEFLISNFLQTSFSFDGIFAANDHLALGALNALKHHGIQVPNDVKLVGFDNSLYSKLPTPSITTIERNPITLAEQGCLVLIKMMNHETLDSLNYTVPVRLIERESSQ